MKSTKKTIAYVNQCFPRLTETFVYREINALRELGFDVVTVANRGPVGEKLSAEAVDFVSETSYVFPLQWFSFVGAHCVLIARRPCRYMTTLAFLATRRGLGWRGRIRTLAHFAGGVFLAARLRRRGVEHLHAHFATNATTLALVMSRLLGVPFSFTVHNNVFTDRLLLREKLEAARFVVAISEFSREWVLRWAHVSEDVRRKFHVVHCGIEIDRFAVASSPPAGGLPRLVCLAQLAQRKGVPTLVHACGILHERGIQFECVIGGDGVEAPLLKRMIEEGGLRSVVRLVGTFLQEELSDFLERASLFVLPCRVADDGDMDGVPVVLMEAMAMAIPVVSTTVSGIPELICHETSGWLVPQQDPVALADALECLLGDAALAQRIGARGRDRVFEAFDLRKSALALDLLFQSPSLPGSC